MDFNDINQFIQGLTGTYPSCRLRGASPRDENILLAVGITAGLALCAGLASLSDGNSTNPVTQPALTATTEQLTALQQACLKSTFVVYNSDLGDRNNKPLGQATVINTDGANATFATSYHVFTTGQKKFFINDRQGDSIPVEEGRFQNNIPADVAVVTAPQKPFASPELPIDVPLLPTNKTLQFGDTVYHCGGGDGQMNITAAQIVTPQEVSSTLLTWAEKRDLVKTGFFTKPKTLGTDGTGQIPEKGDSGGPVLWVDPDDNTIYIAAIITGIDTREGEMNVPENEDANTTSAPQLTAKERFSFETHIRHAEGLLQR